MEQKIRTNGQRNVNGISAKTGGVLSLYDGYEKLRSRTYKDRQQRILLMREWFKDCQMLKPRNNYYFIIEPKIQS